MNKDINNNNNNNSDDNSTDSSENGGNEWVIAVNKRKEQNKLRKTQQQVEQLQQHLQTEGSVLCLFCCLLSPHSLLRASLDSLSSFPSL